MDINQAFGQALKELRMLRGKTQEDFSEVSSRTYISSLERGMKSPTIEKVDQLAKEMNVDPLAIMILSYANLRGEIIGEVINDVTSQLEEIF